MKGILPPSANPTPTSTMPASAMPTLKKRWGNALAKKPDWVDAETSASSTTTFSLTAPYSASALPYATRTDSISATVHLRLSQFGHGLLVLLRRRRAAVPGALVLHVGNTLALYGVSDDDRRLGVDLPQLVKRLQDLAHVVSVDLLDVPPEAEPLVRHRLHRHDVGGHSV